MNFCNQSYKQPCDFLTAQSGVEQLDDPKEDHSDGVFGVDENYYSSPEVSNACRLRFNDEQMIGGDTADTTLYSAKSVHLFAYCAHPSCYTRLKKLP